MTETSTPMKFIIGFGALLAVATPTFIGGQYVADLRHEMDAAKREVEFLKGQITQLQGVLGNQSGVTGVRGPKGDKGEPGLQGPRGERGPQGPTGPAGISSGLSEEHIRQIIQQSVQQQIAAMPATTGGTIQVTLGGADIFNSSGCIPVEQIRNLGTLTLRSGQEFCDRDGRLLARVNDFMSNGAFYMTRPGTHQDSCMLESTCTLRWLGGKRYVYERLGEDERGRIALLRLRQ